MNLTSLRNRLRQWAVSPALRNSKAHLDEELQFHIEQSTQANIASGMTPTAARRQALLDFGGLESTREATYSQRPGWLLETLLQDVRYALRGFRRNPAFTLTVLATLALAIGATTAVFSVVDPILFRALPYANADRLVSIGLVQSLERQEFMLGGFFYEWRDNQRPFAAMAGQSTNPHACNLAGDNPVQLNCVAFQASFLPLLGISPILGRNFLPEEDRPGGPSVVLITYGLWQSRYGLDPHILNRLLDIDGTPARVIGVLPKAFELPTLQDADVIQPLTLVPPQDQLKQNGGIGQPMRVFARLKPGIPIAQAIAQMGPLFQHTQETFIPEAIRKDFHLSIRSLRDRQTQDVQLMAWVIFGSVLAVLLIACANVASLMLARAAAREREMAVRSALGASRGRLIRQTLTEALLLSIGGAALGLALGEGLLRLFIALAPASIPYLDRAGLDLRIAAFTLLLSLLCGAAFGLAPALERPRPSAFAARTAGATRHAFLRKGMVAAQIAISMVLLSGAVLLLRSFRNLEVQSLGMQPAGVLTARMALPGFHDTPVAGMVSRNGPKQAGLFTQAEAAVRHLPGVRAVGWSESLPPGGGFQDARRFSDFAVDGQVQPETGNNGLVRFRGVTPGYFRALQIPIVRGQNFTEDQRESKQRWLILSRLAALRMFGGRDPIGQRIAMGTDRTWLTVVGVAENVKNGGLSEPEMPEVYWLRRNEPSDWGSPVPMMVIATDLSPEVVAPWVRAQIAQIAPTASVKIDTLNRQLSKLADRPRFATALLGFFAFTGLGLALVGLYGLTAYMAQRRTQEIGIRMALGATRPNILRLIAWEGLRLVAFGSVIGIAAALAVTRALSSLLFNVGPRDPASLIGAALLLAMVALAATLIPARTAMQVDPAESLRCQ
jgi:putative ABC transport system permease protein